MTIVSPGPIRIDAGGHGLARAARRGVGCSTWVAGFAVLDREESRASLVSKQGAHVHGFVRRHEFAGNGNGASAGNSP
jgi:hypothetical protein